MSKNILIYLYETVSSFLAQIIALAVSVRFLYFDYLYIMARWFVLVVSIIWYASMQSFTTEELNPGFMSTALRTNYFHYFAGTNKLEKIFNGERWVSDFRQRDFWLEQITEIINHEQQY
jgi:hypothetical protein